VKKHDRSTVKLSGRRCRCPVCGEPFNTAAGFDKHRVGQHGTDDRRCLNPDEMRALGMARAHSGFWVTRLQDEAALWPMAGRKLR
jgi:hypothetical protein